MVVTVKFFASMEESLGKSEEILESAEIESVFDVWCQVSGETEKPSNVLAAVNASYARFDESVKDGDEIAFFPPVTGG